MGFWGKSDHANECKNSAIIHNDIDIANIVLLNPIDAERYAWRPATPLSLDNAQNRNGRIWQPNFVFWPYRCLPSPSDGAKLPTTVSPGRIAQLVSLIGRALDSASIARQGLERLVGQAGFAQSAIYNRLAMGSPDPLS